MVDAIPTLVPRLTDAGTTASAAALEGTLRWWRGAWGRPDAALDLLQWSRLVSRRRRPRWAHEHELVFATPIARLRDFSVAGADRVVPTLVLPPQAGHDSCIVDFSRRQSQLAVLRDAGLRRLFSLDWVGATTATKDSTIDDYLAVIDAAVDHAGGGPVNLVGDCQGGWLAAIWAALRPEAVNTLTIAGGPIDFRVGEPVIGDYVAALPPSFYRALVAVGGGVLKGEFLLGGFVAINPESEVDRQLALLRSLDEPDHLDRYAAFEDWFKHTQDIPGAFYLWVVDHLFRRNALVAGELEIGGERVDLANIRAPLFLLGGAADHITPPPQVFALADHASTPAARVVRRTTGGGHLGLFMGTEALRRHWPPLMAAVYERSRRRRRRGSPLAARKPS
jgi:poly(3-hydroxybutyrate) depolymerase